MKTINLLPKARQQELQYVRQLKSLWGYMAISLVTFGLVLLGQFGAKLYLENMEEVMDKRIESLRQQVSKDENAKIKAEIVKVNNLSADFNKLSQDAPQWSKVLTAFASLPPEGVKIHSMTANLQTKEITIQGYAPTRELTIQLRDNIAADTEHFANINNPLENLVDPINVSFHFSFTIKDSLLK